MNKRLSCWPLLLFLTVTQFALSGHAQYLTGPVATGAGGAGRAAAEDGEQIFLNPSTIVHGSVFASSLFYFDGYSAEKEHDKGWGFSLADNSDEVILAGGYSFVRRRRTFAVQDSIDQDYHQVSVGQFVLRHLAVGLTVLYLKTDIEKGKSYDQWDGHLGFHYNPTPEFAVGLVFYNVGSRDTDVPTYIQNLDKIALGAYYIFMPQFRFRFDISQQQVVNPDKEVTLQGGIESKIDAYNMVRVGYENDPLLDRKYVTLGYTFDGPRIKIDYSYRKNVDYSEGAMHGVDFRLPFW